MDSLSLLVVLTLHLVGMCGLLFLVWRLMPGAPGLGMWCISSLVLAGGYGARVVTIVHWLEPVGLLADGLVLLSSLLLLEGLRQFVGRTRVHPGVLVAVWAGMMLSLAAASWWGGATSRHVLLNVIVTALCGTHTWVAWREARNANARRWCAPMWVLATMMGGLAVLSAMRAWHFSVLSLQEAFRGTHAQIFFLYMSLTAVVVGLTLLWMMFLRLTGQLSDLAGRDPLTQVLNRNGLQVALRGHFERRDAAPMTLLLLDVDHFKSVNDQHGHLVGDHVLKAVAEAVVSQLRSGDFVARVGGEEFLVGCADVRPGASMALAERLRRCVESKEVNWPGSASDAGPITTVGALSCTVSVGVSEPFTRLPDWERAMRQADEALYCAKAGGRNLVKSHQPAPDLGALAGAHAL